MSSLPKVTVHTDGGCEGNPGPGGWGAVLQYGSQQLEIKGSAIATTNNRMELLAAISAFRALNQPCAVTLWTDSEYLKNGMTKWIKGWKARGWKTAEKKPVKNEDLWRELDGATAQHTIDWKWLKGHAGHPLNERCDELARQATDRLKRVTSAAARREALEQFKLEQKSDS